MCGVAGCVGEFLPGLVERMNALQAHRGPDGRGVFEDAEAGVALAHVRLSILDLSGAASQPMHSEDGRFVLVFNGEIYNFRELRAELEARGRAFRSSGDTEVLLQGLIEFGTDFTTKLNGMFAFALWDRRERELALARDQMGVKPLYLAEPKPGVLLFASEIKALYAHPALSREPDFIALRQHLAYCHAVGERTALKAVRRLEPGRLLRWRAGQGSRIERYWRPRFIDGASRGAETASGIGGRGAADRDEAALRLRGLIQEATLRQLVSDVPVGSFLSGGLDSSLLTVAATVAAGREFRAFTVAYPSSENVLDRAAEDGPYARRVAASLGLPFTEIEIKPDVAELWPRLIHHLDEPIADPAAIACYLICRLAREGGVSVLLSGQGADELFCGYPRYMAVSRTAWVDSMPMALRRLAPLLAGLLPGAAEGRFGALSRRVRRVLSGLALSPERRFLALCANTPAEEISRVLGPAFLDALAREANEAVRDSVYAEDLRRMADEGLPGLRGLQERDLSTYLPNHNLLYTDKMGMAVGLEARVPFLDLELTQAASGWPAEWSLTGGVPKAILRKAARGIVPDWIIDRPKAGFGAPYRKWLRYDLADLWEDLTSEASVRRRGWFDHAALRDARARSQAGKTDLYMLQWCVLTTELWARRFVDADPGLS